MQSNHKTTVRQTAKVRCITCTVPVSPNVSYYTYLDHQFQALSISVPIPFALSQVSIESSKRKKKMNSKLFIKFVQFVKQDSVNPVYKLIKNQEYRSTCT